ncbi:DNA repair protein XRCC2 [Linepithema humile]|uniref:DNA repair protein XRCC2 n=1 Tax=Linepithema humile TaxID=83485 RepID=UPI000623AC67|nr:PREDICTED: DNA repair protein XRCC2-like [Linepithema humile]
MQFHSEDGLELLSRFNEKLQSINPDEVLFSDIDNKSVIEIVGGLSTGKTLLLCQFIAKCILPERYNGIKINGHNVHAILIDTLGHIRMSKVAELMSSMIRNIADTQLAVDTIDLIVNKSLENLTVISCCNNEQLQLTLHMLEDELIRNNRVAMLAIDNILAYYWQERRTKILSMDQYAKSLIKLIQLRMSQFHIMTIYTKWDEPVHEHKAHLKYTNVLEGTDINYRLQLCKNTVTHEFIANIQSAKNVRQIRYSIFDSGIKWILQ